MKLDVALPLVPPVFSGADFGDLQALLQAIHVGLTSPTIVPPLTLAQLNAAELAVLAAIDAQVSSIIRLIPYTGAMIVAENR